MPIFTWLSLLIATLLALLFPFLFGELMVAGLARLHVGPQAAILLIISIVISGLINIPVKRIVRDDETVMYPFAVFGLYGLWPERRRIRRETIIAVNLGGCLIPTGLALYIRRHRAFGDRRRLPGLRRCVSAQSCR
jgi:uncharacterized membrane protein